MGVDNQGLKRRMRFPMGKMREYLARRCDISEFLNASSSEVGSFLAGFCCNRKGEFRFKLCLWWVAFDTMTKDDLWGDDH